MHITSPFFHFTESSERFHPLPEATKLCTSKVSAKSGLIAVATPKAWSRARSSKPRVCSFHSAASSETSVACGVGEKAMMRSGTPHTHANVVAYGRPENLPSGFGAADFDDSTKA